jgi:hypothetical protein
MLDASVAGKLGIEEGGRLRWLAYRLPASMHHLQNDEFFQNVRTR